MIERKPEFMFDFIVCWWSMGHCVRLIWKEFAPEKVEKALKSGWYFWNTDDWWESPYSEEGMDVKENVKSDDTWELLVKAVPNSDFRL